MGILSQGGREIHQGIIQTLRRMSKNELDNGPGNTVNRVDKRKY